MIMAAGSLVARSSAVRRKCGTTQVRLLPSWDLYTLFNAHSTWRSFVVYPRLLRLWTDTSGTASVV